MIAPETKLMPLPKRKKKKQTKSLLFYLYLGKGLLSYHQNSKIKQMKYDLCRKKRKGFLGKTCPIVSSYRGQVRVVQN